MYDLRAMERHRQRSAVDPEAFEALRAHVEHQDAVIERMKGTIDWLTSKLAAKVVRQAEVEARGLLAIKTAAFEVRVTEGTIRNWFGKGLPAVTIGVRRYVNRDALREYVARK